MELKEALVVMLDLPRHLLLVLLFTQHHFLHRAHLLRIPHLHIIHARGLCAQINLCIKLLIYNRKLLKNNGSTQGIHDTYFHLILFQAAGLNVELALRGIWGNDGLHVYVVFVGSSGLFVIKVSDNQRKEYNIASTIWAAGDQRRSSFCCTAMAMFSVGK